MPLTATRAIRFFLRGAAKIWNSSHLTAKSSNIRATKWMARAMIATPADSDHPGIVAADVRRRILPRTEFRLLTSAATGLCEKSFVSLADIGYSESAFAA